MKAKVRRHRAFLLLSLLLLSLLYGCYYYHCYYAEPYGSLKLRQHYKTTDIWLVNGL